MCLQTNGNCFHTAPMHTRLPLTQYVLIRQASTRGRSRSRRRRWRAPASCASQRRRSAAWAAASRWTTRRASCATTARRRRVVAVPHCSYTCMGSFLYDSAAHAHDVIALSSACNKPTVSKISVDLCQSKCAVHSWSTAVICSTRQIADARPRPFTCEPLHPGDSCPNLDLAICGWQQEADVYQRYLANVNQLEGQFAALWTQCQRCQVRCGI